MYITDKLGGYIQALNIAIYFVILIAIFTDRNIIIIININEF